MKKNILIIGLCALAVPCGLSADAVQDILGVVSGVTQPKIIIPGVREEKQQRLELLEKKLADQQVHTEQFHERIAAEHNKVREARKLISSDIRAGVEDEADARELAALNERLQVLSDMERTREQLIKTVEAEVALIRKYITDPDHEFLKKEMKLVDAPGYTFNDIVRINEMIRELEQRLQQYNELLKNVQTEQKARERTLATIVHELKKRHEELASLDTEMDPALAEALRAEQQLYETRREYVQFQIEESLSRVELNTFHVYLTKAHLSIVKEYLQRIKSGLRISESDVIEAKENLKRLQQDYFTKRDTYRLQIEELDKQYKIQEAALDSACKQYAIPSGADLDDWSREPKQNVNAYAGLCKVGLINASVQFLRKSKELLEAQIFLEEERFTYVSLQARAKETYYKIYARRFATEDQTTKEVKQYETLRTTALASLATYKEKMAASTELLNTQKKIADNLEKLRLDVHNKQNTLFRNNPQEFAQCLDFIRRSERKVRETTELLGKLTGIYSSIITEVSAAQRITSFIVGELQSIITIWYRPSYAISWRGVQKALSDIGIFAHEISAYGKRFNATTFIGRMSEAIQVTGVFAALISKLLTLLIVLAFILLFGRSFVMILSDIASSSRGFVKIGAYLVMFTLMQVRAHILSLALWGLIYAFMSSHAVPDPYMYGIFMLLSIPYWIYVIRSIAVALDQFNMHHNYPLLSPEVQKRFIFVLSIFACATTALVLFRFAFLQINYYQPDLYRSEVPNIIVALNFIVLQISLMLLITKEQLLSIIPQKNMLTAGLYTFVDTYYYLIFCCALVVIIMSHPYVGYSRLVIYVVGGVIYSAILLKILFSLHGFLRRTTKFVFFDERDEIVRERFDGAKTWFGLSLIASFLCFSFIGILVAARIWGWPITFRSSMDWFREPLLLKASSNPITVISLMMILAFILTGFLISYALNQFVLERIFDLLLVDSGVQNMITRLLRYIIVATAVMIAFHSVGLGGLVTWFIAALGLSIGWVLKDPVADVVAYFIILVQRPVKIGDYVRLGDNLTGVVRKITPRAVVLRRKNSMTIVVPNTQVITRPIENWNYTRNFVAFDDIMVAVHFGEDPGLVKQMLMQAVSEHPQVLKNPKPIIRLDDFDARGYMFMVRGYVNSAYTLDQWDIASDVRILIVQKLRAHGMELAVPFLQMGNYDHATPFIPAARDKIPPVL